MTSIDMNTQLIDVAQVSFFLALNIFCFLFYCSLCQLETSKCELGILLVCADNHAIFKYCVIFFLFFFFFLYNLASRGVWQHKCSANFKRQLEYAWNQPVLKLKLYQNKFISVFSVFKKGLLHNYFSCILLTTFFRTYFDGCFCQ